MLTRRNWSRKLKNVSIAYIWKRIIKHFIFQNLKNYKIFLCHKGYFCSIWIFYLHLLLHSVFRRKIFWNLSQNLFTETYNWSLKKSELNCVTILLTAASNPESTSADLEKKWLVGLASPSSILGKENLQKCVWLEQKLVFWLIEPSFWCFAWKGWSGSNLESLIYNQLWKE